MVAAVSAVTLKRPARMLSQRRCIYQRLVCNMISGECRRYNVIYQRQKCRSVVRAVRYGWTAVDLLNMVDERRSANKTGKREKAGDLPTAGCVINFFA